ncbi:MAG: flagellar type III secretion system protein FliR [Alphaproteobacteria bacterium]|nr:flagellar type III secretion system protein FliR [Alphaproteobacteria bacterium]
MLQQILPVETFAFLLVFCRVGASLMLVPGIGEVYVAAPIRLVLALAVSFLIAPFVVAGLPPLPADGIGVFLLIANETLIGLFIGGVARLAISALHAAGTVIAFQSSLGFSTFYDPTQGAQSALIATFFSMLGVMLIFAADLHLLMLRATVDSYVLFPARALPPLGEFAMLAAGFVAGAFKLGIQVAAPFLVYGIVFNIGLGAVNRLMPSMQVLFVAMPLQILLAFVLLTFSVGAAMIWFLEYYEGAASALLAR